MMNIADNPHLHKTDVSRSPYRKLSALGKKVKPLILKWLSNLFGYENYPNSFKEYSRTEIIGGEQTNFEERTLNEKYPQSVLEFSNASQVGKLRQTQKPVALLEYLVKTYTNEGDTVLDNTMGSGTTNLACLKLNRKSIGIEKEKQYYDIAVRGLS